MQAFVLHQCGQRAGNGRALRCIDAGAFVACVGRTPGGCGHVHHDRCRSDHTCTQLLAYDLARQQVHACRGQPAQPDAGQQRGGVRRPPVHRAGQPAARHHDRLPA
ncbi:hypothetical protein G6F24_018531 [Rhizopus arrhizus]|nr:hypothetical protein G6F24_018531 [Rhizopus arrhizus]